jgi:hypothetical protein
MRLADRIERLEQELEPTRRLVVIGSSDEAVEAPGVVVIVTGVPRSPGFASFEGRGDA